MKKWYALAVQAGKEKTVRGRIVQRLDKHNQNVADLQIIAPEEEVSVGSRGEVKRKRRMSMPGYLLLHSRYIPDPALVLMKQTPGVLGFLGGDERPSVVPESEILGILGRDASEVQHRERESLFQVGDSVVLVDGPLAEFSGQVLEIFPDRQDARVEVEIFGRSTPSTVPLQSLRPS